MRDLKDSYHGTNPVGASMRTDKIGGSSTKLLRKGTDLSL